MSTAVQPLNSSPLRPDFLQVAGSIVLNEMQRRKLIAQVTRQVSIGGPAEAKSAHNFGHDTAAAPAHRPAAFESFDAREFNRLLHYLRMQMAISRWDGMRPRDWFDRTGLHFKQKQRAGTLARIAAEYKRAFS